MSMKNIIRFVCGDDTVNILKKLEDSTGIGRSEIIRELIHLIGEQIYGIKIESPIAKLLETNREKMA